MAANVRKLNSTLKWVEDNRHLWNQKDWINECGTQFCFAGVVIHRSKRFKFVKSPKGWWTAEVRRVGDMRTTGALHDGWSGVYSPTEAAADELRLTCLETSLLFAGSNNLKTLRKEVKRIATGYYRDPKYIRKLEGPYYQGDYYTRELIIAD